MGKESRFWRGFIHAAGARWAWVEDAIASVLMDGRMDGEERKEYVQQGGRSPPTKIG